MEPQEARDEVGPQGQGDPRVLPLLHLECHLLVLHGTENWKLITVKDTLPFTSLELLQKVARTGQDRTTVFEAMGGFGGRSHAVRLWV